MANGDLSAGNLFQVRAGEITTPSVKERAIHSDALDGSTLEKNSTSGKVQVAESSDGSQGVQSKNLHYSAGFVARGSLTASDSAAGIFSVENTTGAALVAIVDFRVTTGSAGACTVDVGTDATGTGSSDNIMDGFSVAAGGSDVRNHCSLDSGDAGTNGKTYTVWAAGEYITASMASGATSGLVGTYTIHARSLEN